MPSYIAPALLIGLGARIFIDLLSNTEPSAKDFLLIGAWQGIGLHYALHNSGLGIPVACAIVAKLFIDFNFTPDITRCATTVFGGVFGVLITDFLSQNFDKSHEPEPERRRKRTHVPTPSQEVKRQRLVQFRDSVQGGSTSSVPYKRSMFSDITSVDSDSELIGSKYAMSQMEREIAALRARASLADSERRRYKEERKWAISQGNMARASQMKWQVRHYTALMLKFHREADQKVLESSRSPQDGLYEQQLATSTSNDRSIRSREQHVNGNGNGNSKTLRPDGKPTARRSSTSKHISRDAVR